jgi:predicted DNA-binding transcriptional regulator YafY
MVSDNTSIRQCSPACPADSLSHEGAPQIKTTRPPLERMHYIHGQLAAGKYPNCSSVAKRFEVSARTIQRDIDYMRDRLLLPIDYDANHRGYFYYQHVDALPTVQMSTDDWMSLLVARAALAQYAGSPWAPRIQEVIRKISSGLDQLIASSGIDSAISFHTTGTAQVDPAIFRQVCDAVLQPRELRFRYRKYRTSRPDSRRIHPYHLSCVNGSWHVVGMDLERNVIRAYGLERIHALEVTETRFQRPANFSATEYFERTFGIVVEEGMKEVVLRFRGRAAWQVSQRVWHPTQQIIQLGEQEVEMRLHVSSIREVVGWVLGWGEQVTVLEPAELIARVATEAQQVAKLYPVKNSVGMEAGR